MRTSNVDGCIYHMFSLSTRQDKTCPLFDLDMSVVRCRLSVRHWDFPVLTINYFPYNNKTGLQPVSRPVKQILGFFLRVQKVTKKWCYHKIGKRVFREKDCMSWDKVYAKLKHCMYALNLCIGGKIEF